MCDEWLHDFAAFFAYLGKRPTPSHSLDRIDVNGHYEPGNVRWATSKQQSTNHQNTVTLTFRGQTKPLYEWADEVGIDPKALYLHVFRRGWSHERALTTPRLSSRLGCRNRSRTGQLGIKPRPE